MRAVRAGSAAIAAALFPAPVLKIVALFTLTVFLSLFPGAGESAVAQESGSASATDGSLEWYEHEIRRALVLERYDRAMRLIEAGRSEYPEAIELSIVAGDLFADRGLYRRALDEYREAEAEHPGDDGAARPEMVELLRRIADTLGRMNRDQEAIPYYERLIELAPDDISIAGDAGWTWFKTQNAERGIEVVESALERLGSDPGVEMTLGTLYASLYDHENALAAYRAAVEGAREEGFSALESVALYNLSLLEKAFYRFEESFEATERSIEVSERASAYLSRGGLHERRMDFPAAERDYRRAYAIDQETPLPRMALSSLYRRFGDLDSALGYARSVSGERDLSWLYNFGSDDVRHRMDSHEALYKVYRARFHRGRFGAGGGLSVRVRRGAERVHDRIMWWYHRQRFRRKARALAERFIDSGQELDGRRYAFSAQAGSRALVLRSLDRARVVETALIPPAEADYRLDRALIEEDRGRLQALLSAFDSPWQADRREAALGGLIEKMRPGRRIGDYDRIAAALYELNPGGFLTRGRPIPAALVVDGLDTSEHRRLASALERAGIRIRPEEQARVPLLVALDLSSHYAGIVRVYRRGEEGREEAEHVLLRERPISVPQHLDRRSAGDLADRVVNAITQP